MAEFARTHTIDKVNRFLVIGLLIAAACGGIRWWSIQDIQTELTSTIKDIVQLQTQAERIIRLQTLVDQQQDIVTRRIDERLDRIDQNTETIRAVVVQTQRQ